MGKVLTSALRSVRLVLDYLLCTGYTVDLADCCDVFLATVVYDGD